jgi:hypothetical protein
MKRFAYTKASAGQYKLYDCADRQPLKDSNTYSALLMSRLDFHISILDLPPIPEHSVRGMLQYKLKSIYPGDPTLTDFDYKILKTAKEKYAIIFITKKKYLKKYRQLAGNAGLFLPISLLLPYIRKQKEGNSIFCFWNDNWIECIVLKNKKINSSTVINRSSQIAQDIKKIKSILPQLDKNSHYFSFCNNSEENIIIEQFKLLMGTEIKHSVLAFKDLYKKGIKKANLLFTPEKKIRTLPRNYRINILVFMIFLLTAFIIHNEILKVELYHDKLSGTLEELSTKRSDILPLQNSIDELNKELNNLKQKKPLDVSQLLSELSKILTSNTVITSFVLKNDTFQIEAQGPNPFTLMDKFKKHEQFQDAELSQIIPIDDSIKYFKLSGKFNAK